MVVASFSDPQSTTAWDGHLAMHFMEGTPVVNLPPFSVNEHRALSYYRASMKQGWSMALCTVGTMMKNGILFPRNYQQATELLTEAANKGDPLAASNMGHMHLQGMGMPRDTVTACAFLEQAAQAGLYQAMLCLGQVGMQVPACYDLGQKWAQKLSEAPWESPSAHVEAVREKLREYYKL